MSDNESGQRAARGIEMHAAHFPGRAAIDAYGSGGFRFAEMSHQGSILCLPDSISRWDVAQYSDLHCDHFAQVISRSDIEVFLLGLGADFRPLEASIKALFKEAGITIDPMSTGAAVRTYNVLLSESRAVACGLIAVD